MDVLQSYVQSTTRRLDAVVAKAKAMARGELDISVAPAALLTSPRTFTVSSPIPIPVAVSPRTGLPLDMGRSSSLTSSSPIFCANCGASIGEHHNFCVKCGSPRTTELSQRRSSTEYTPPQPPLSTPAAIALPAPQAVQPAPQPAGSDAAALDELERLRQQVASLQTRLRESQPDDSLAMSPPQH